MLLMSNLTPSKGVRLFFVSMSILILNVQFIQMNIYIISLVFSVFKGVLL